MSEDQGKPDNEGASRAATLRAVDNPLRFLALVALVMEAILGAVVTIADADQRRVIVWALVLVPTSLSAVVVVLAWLRPESLRGERPPGVNAPNPPASEGPRKAPAATPTEENALTLALTCVTRVPLGLVLAVPMLFGGGFFVPLVVGVCGGLIAIIFGQLFGAGFKAGGGVGLFGWCVGFATVVAIDEYPSERRPMSSLVVGAATGASVAVILHFAQPMFATYSLGACSAAGAFLGAVSGRFAADFK